ncbi:VPS10 domain-containing receptor SorCS2 [Heterocephalus glaber]|uniref:VPS10 domain-containing receptor SorCS2 n=1 Tax=Heterocephalus glaber TaxID=10181 RepID=G5B301_HETGA|nr:VPS10 domain-containing receptor SorCS2 [Heterocephalus glaber]
MPHESHLLPPPEKAGNECLSRFAAGEKAVAGWEGGSKRVYKGSAIFCLAMALTRAAVVTPKGRQDPKDPPASPHGKRKDSSHFHFRLVLGPQVERAPLSVWRLRQVILILTKYYHADMGKVLESSLWRSKAPWLFSPTWLSFPVGLELRRGDGAVPATCPCHCPAIQGPDSALPGYELGLDPLPDQMKFPQLAQKSQLSQGGFSLSPSVVSSTEVAFCLQPAELSRLALFFPAAGVAGAWACGVEAALQERGPWSQAEPFGAICEEFRASSSDFGTSYTKLTLQPGVTTIIDNFYICPTNKRKIILVSSSLSDREQNLFLSTDEGTSFQRQPITFLVETLLFHPRDEDKVLAYTKESKLYVSLDLGKKWTLLQEQVTKDHVFWAVSGVDADPNLVHMETQDLSGGFRYVTCQIHSCSDEMLAAPFPGPIDHGSLAVQDDYVLLKTTSTNQTKYYVSYRRNEFVLMKLPKYALPKDLQVISTDESQVFVAGGEWYQTDTYNLYQSDPRGVRYALVLEDVRSSRQAEESVLIDILEGQTRRPRPSSTVLTRCGTSGHGQVGVRECFPEEAAELSSSQASSRDSTGTDPGRGRSNSRGCTRSPGSSGQDPDGDARGKADTEEAEGPGGLERYSHGLDLQGPGSWDKHLRLEAPVCESHKGDLDLSGESIGAQWALGGPGAWKEAAEGIREVRGVKGVFLANRKVDGKVMTLITYNKGRDWDFLRPPSSDMNGKPTNCQPPDCHLHLHLRWADNPYVSGTVHTKDTTPGLIMGAGNLGSQLVEYKEEMYITADCGRTWRQVFEEEHHILYLDHGGVIVAIKDTSIPLKILKFSVDGGVTWSTHNFTSTSVFVDGLLSEPGDETLGTGWAAGAGPPGPHRASRGHWEPAGARQAPQPSTVQELGHPGPAGSIVGPAAPELARLVFGHISFRSDWELVKVDFRPSFSRPCGENDYSSWDLTSLQGDRCIMGQQRSFRKRKPASWCVQGRSFTSALTARVCQCRDSDFLCDYGFERTPSLEPGTKCVANFWFNPLAPPDDCAVGQTYTSSLGYRKVVSNVCEGGVDLWRGPGPLQCPLTRPRGLRVSILGEAVAVRPGEDVLFVVRQEQVSGRGDRLGMGYRKVVSNVCEGGVDLWRGPGPLQCPLTRPRGLRVSILGEAVAVRPGEDVLFVVRQEQGDILTTKYQVDLGDGFKAMYVNLTLTAEPIRHRYESPGVYRVSVRAENVAGHDEAVLFVQVNSPLQALYLEVAPVVGINQDMNLTAVLLPPNPNLTVFYWWIGHSLQPLLSLDNSVTTRFAAPGDVRVSVQAACGSSVLQDSRVVRVLDQFQLVPLCFSRELDALNPNTPEWREDVGLVVTRLLSKETSVPEELLVTVVRPGLPTVADLYVLLPPPRPTRKRSLSSDKRLTAVRQVLSAQKISFLLQGGLRVLVALRDTDTGARVAVLKLPAAGGRGAAAWPGDQGRVQDGGLPGREAQTRVPCARRKRPGRTVYAQMHNEKEQEMTEVPGSLSSSCRLQEVEEQQRGQGIRVGTVYAQMHNEKEQEMTSPVSRSEDAQGTAMQGNHSGVVLSINSREMHGYLVS